MKRRSNWNEARLESQTPPKWRSNNKIQVKGTNVVALEPITKTDTLYEFELGSAEILGFGLLTGFLVEGQFETLATTENATWAVCPAAEKTKVSVQSNWFEHLIRDINVFHVNAEINPHDVPLNADAFLHTYLLAYMDQFTKLFLCPEPCNPGNATSSNKDGWKVSTTSDYTTKYAPAIFGKEVKFRYIPMFKFPFYQSANFVMDAKKPTALPMPIIGNMYVRLYLKNDLTKIFKKIDGNAAKYRFNIKSIKLMVEEMRLSPTAEKQFLSLRKPIEFAGVTKLGMAHNIPAGVFSYTAKLNKIYLPEGIFIFCLPKTVIPGTFEYSTSTTDAVFLEHKLQKVEVYFGGKTFYSKSPTPFDLNVDLSNEKIFFDHLISPPFGVHQNPALATFSNLENGAALSAFPHVYINLTQGNSESRLVTNNDSGSGIAQKEFLDTILQFGGTGPNTNATYFIYYFYTDTNVCFDTISKRFTNVYNNSKITV